MENKRLSIGYFSILICILILLPFLENIVKAVGSNYEIHRDSYELTDTSGF